MPLSHTDSHSHTHTQSSFPSTLCRHWRAIKGQPNSPHRSLHHPVHRPYALHPLILVFIFSACCQAQRRVIAADASASPSIRRQPSCSRSRVQPHNRGSQQWLAHTPHAVLRLSRPARNAAVPGVVLLLSRRALRLFLASQHSDCVDEVARGGLQQRRTRAGDVGMATGGGRRRRGGGRRRTAGSGRRRRAS